MRRAQKLLGGFLALAIAAAVAAPANGSTFIRASLDDLVAGNEAVVVGEVIGTKSYWNSDGSFILTDARIAPREILKGKLDKRELTVTVMGGTVGDLTTVIVGGAQLVQGNSYVLFLNHDDLPGAPSVRTVRYHSQGVFDVVLAKDGLRAISQANRHPLLPDAKGRSEAPGGVAGVPLTNLANSIRELVAHPQGSGREVK
jgi:hypothetical protein